MPTHLKGSTHPSRSECGTWAHLTTDDPRRVDCLRCRKTKAWKEAIKKINRPDGQK